MLLNLRTRGWRAALATLLVGVGLPVVAATPAAADDWLYRPSSGVFSVKGHGEGHGRGMSQYGAQGAASQGRTSAQILDFYYPGTAATQLDPNRALKVWLSADTDSVTEVLRTPDLTVVDGNGAAANLPGDVDRIRTKPVDAGFIVQGRSGGSWYDLTPRVPGPVRLYASGGGVTEVLMPSGDRFGYRGSILAVRNGSGAVTVNEVRLDDYVRGVVPRESISSWLPAALQTQAVAARTFASVTFGSPRSSLYNICDYNACQVYGGATRNGASQEVASTSAATDATAGLIRTYNGSPINAQFGSTNGGWTVSGGTPYLIAQADPFEAAANPPQSYANWTGSLSASTLESRFPGIGSFTRLRIAQRDGNGEWGGRVVSAVLEGSSGSLTITGDQLRQAITAPVRSTYFQLFDLDAGNLPVGSLDAATAGGSAVLVSGWALDANAPTAPIDVHVYDFGPGGTVRATAVTAGTSRPDVTALYPGTGGAHGFRALLPTSGRGTHNICVFAINVLAGTKNPLLGCREITVGNPFGSLDTAVAVPGSLSLTGWAIDPDVPTASTEIHVYASGPGGTTGYSGIRANGLRADVAGAYPGSGEAHGFTAAVPLTREGSYRICAYAIAVRPGGVNPAVGCRDLRVVNPVGSLDGVRVQDGQLVAGGWTLDPASGKRTVEVHLYVRGPNGTAGYSGISAGEQRADIGSAFPEAGPAHGYQRVVPAQGSGANTVCAFAISTGASTGNPLLGCRTVTVP